MQSDEVRKSAPRTLQSGESGQEIADNDSDELVDGPYCRAQQPSAGNSQMVRLWNFMLLHYGSLTVATFNLPLFNRNLNKFHRYLPKFNCNLLNFNHYIYPNQP